MTDAFSKLAFPRAFAFAIDDLGWNEGSSLAEMIPPGPHRAGVKRTFYLKDYEYIVAVAKAVGARIQSLFILSEMDRENVLAKYPTTTWQRDQWNNSAKVNDQQKIIMKYVCESAAYMEFGLHGTGHEWWADDGIQRRAEWYNLKDRQPWPEELVRDHIQAFKDIMAQYDLDPAHGHSFPESFVPCAYSYYWNPTGNYSLGKLLTEAGVKYANTDFAQIPELSPPNELNGGGFDFGTHVINRMNFGNLWFELNSLPKTPPEQQSTDIIESHWPNWLAQDDALQGEVTNKWISYYENIQRSDDRYIAKNTEQLHSQWLYHAHTIINEPAAGIVEIDNTAMPSQAYQYKMLGNLVLKIKLMEGRHISSATIGSEIIPAYFESEGFGFLYLPPLAQKKYTLHYSTGSNVLPEHVFNDGTYNVYHLTRKDSALLLDIKMYGVQEVRIKCPQPESVTSDNLQLIIEKIRYENEGGWLLLTMSATDMQGVRGIVTLSAKTAELVR